MSRNWSETNSKEGKTNLTARWTESMGKAEK